MFETILHTSSQNMQDGEAINTKTLLRFDQDIGTASNTVDTCGGVVTPNGIKIVAGKFGNAMQVDTGTNMGVMFPGSLLKSSDKKPFTVEMWLKPIAFTGNGLGTQNVFIGMTNGRGTSFKISIATTRVLSVQHYKVADSGKVMATATTLLTAGVFSHVAVSNDGQRYYLHIDGIYQGFSAMSSRTTDPDTWYLCGESGRSSVVIDDFRISNVARYAINGNITVPSGPFILD